MSDLGGKADEICAGRVLLSLTDAVEKSLFELRIFMFQECDHPDASRVFGEIARLTKGAHCHFTGGAARELADLLRAVAAYAAGGRDALLANKTTAAAKLLLQ